MKILWVLLLFIPSSLSAENHNTPPPASIREIENFNAYEVGKFPINFKTFPFQRADALQVYSVQSEDHHKFLSSFDDQDISVQIFRRFEWDLPRWPYFSWRWRAKILPQGAAENNPATNDSGCGVYVVFEGYHGDILKYVWSSTLPVGTVYEKKPGKFYIVVLDSASTHLGNWRTIAVNVIEDYKKIFKKEPSQNPKGFGILTDANATHTAASCDYDDFRIADSPF